MGSSQAWKGMHRPFALILITEDTILAAQRVSNTSSKPRIKREAAELVPVFSPSSLFLRSS